MIRTHRRLRVTGVEATLIALADALDGEPFEIACEDARRRRLTSVAALRTYVDRFGRHVPATWTKVTQHPDQLFEELAATLAA